MTSLFAGVGGFDLGFEEAGIKVVAHVERDPACQKLLKARWPDAVALDDVCTAGAHNLPKSDIICAGFPCQDVSVAGQRAGLAGNRSGLFYQFTRIAHELQPACLVWENVYGLLSSNKGHDFLAILAEFRRIGYHGGWRTFDAQYFGVAQRRRRIFGVFTRGDIGIECASQILSLREGMRGHPAPRREKGQKVAGTARSGTESGSGEPEDKVAIPPEISPSLTTGSGNQERGDGGHALIPEIAQTLDQRCGRSGATAEKTYVPEIAKALNAGRDGYNDGSDQTYLPQVSCARMTAFGEYVDDGTALTIKQRDFKDATDLVVAVRTANTGANGHGVSEGAAHTLDGNAGSGQAVAIAFTERGRKEGRRLEHQEDVAYTLTNPGDGGRTNDRQVAIAFQPRIGRNGRGQPDEIVSVLNGADSGETRAQDSPTKADTLLAFALYGGESTAHEAEVAGCLRARAPGTVENSSTTVAVQEAKAFTIHGSDKTKSTATETEIAGSVRTKAPGSVENSSTTVAVQDVRAFTGDGVTADPISASEGKTYTHEGNTMRMHNCVETLPHKGFSPIISDASTPQTNSQKLLSALQKEIGEKAFAEWGLGILVSFYSSEVLQSALHGSGLRPAAFPGHWLGRITSSRPTTRAEGTMLTVRSVQGVGCSPQGREFPKQLAEELGAYLSLLSQPGAHATRVLHDLWQADEGSGILREALSAIQEVGRSKSLQTQSTHRTCVRRLVPTECEFLQGFPRDWTRWDGDGKEFSDSTRYRMLGNAICVACSRWLGKRIVEFLPKYLP